MASASGPATGGELEQEKTTVVIVTAGMARSGKSTALNNIYGADFKSVYSATSVTQNTAKGRVEQDDKTVIVVDTPGLGSVDVPLAKVRTELQKTIGGLKYVLIYCYSVAPSSSLSTTDELVVKNLQKVLGKDIWKRCVVLFTFSDFVRRQVYPKESDREEYKDALRRHASELSKMMKKRCGSHVPEIKVVFDVDTEQEVVNEIVAVPVGLELKQDRERCHLLPGRPGLNWVDVALKEIKRKGPPVDRLQHIHVRNDTLSQFISVTSVALGATAGMVAGGAVGLTAGGFGVIPGAMIGTLAGGVAGGVLGGTSGLTIEKFGNRKIKKRVEELKNAQLIEPKRPAQPREVFRLLHGAAKDTDKEAREAVSSSSPTSDDSTRPSSKGSYHSGETPDPPSS